MQDVSIYIKKVWIQGPESLSSLLV